MPKRWAALPRGIRWTIGGIAAVVLGLVIAWALFVPVTDRLAHHDVGSVKGSLHETAVDNARGRLLTLGAGLFAAGALLFTARSFTLSREGQVTDRYTKAIEQLGSDKLDVRIGGIYALERVARDSAKDHPTVMEVLTAFIREHSREPWPPPDPDNPDQPRSTRPDVQAAVTVAGRRDAKRDILPIDLTRAQLTGANLAGADLTRAVLTGANLHGARLTDARLTDARLTRADLTDADLTRADLTRASLTADLTGADLTGARLTDARLTEARLTRADLTDADLAGTNLTRADLTHANLRGARLIGAYLIGAYLTDANLTRANLYAAHLSGGYLTGANLTAANLAAADLAAADLAGANLTGVNLYAARLTAASWPEGELVPEGWRLDPGSGRLEQASGGSRPAETD